MRRITTRIAAAIAVAAIGLAACGGGSSKGATAGGGSSPSASNDAFSQLVAKEKTADFKITYTTSDGKSETIAQDGKGKTAVTSGENLYISDGTNVISCDGTTASAKCTDLGSTGNSIFSGFTAAFTTAYAGLGALNSSVYGGHTTTDTIAGRKATCVTVKASDAGGLAGAIAGKLSADASETSCVDAETGALLKLEGGVNGNTQTVFLATQAGSSSPSDFVPPSTPETTPSFTIPGGGTLPGGGTIPAANG